MATTTARTKEDVNNMTKAERLWDSLNYSYGKKRESSDKQYDQAYSQAGRQLLNRGMQRSSYGLQSLANIDQKKIEAQNDIWDTQIADYENRLGDIEQQELENERWERQYADTRNDVAWNQAFQEKQYENANNQWQLQFNANQEQNAWQRDLTERQYADQKAQNEWQKDLTERQYADTVAQNAWQRDLTERQYADQVANTAWQQQYQQAQADEATRQFNEQLAYSRERAGVSDEQWERQFGMTKQEYDQNLAVAFVQSILANGEMPSDDILAMAGLSREDAEKMMAKKSSGSGKQPAIDKDAIKNALDKFGDMTGGGDETQQPVTDSVFKDDDTTRKKIRITGNKNDIFKGSLNSAYLK